MATATKTKKRTPAKNVRAKGRKSKPIDQSKSKVHLPVKRVRARFDAAQTTNDNSKHWANADSLSPNAAISPEVRRILRNRSRYEVANNSYAQGIIDTLANDTIGTGPTLQLLIDESQSNKETERAFMDWFEEVNLAAKLRTMRTARATDGEVFAILTNNPGLESPVKLDVKIFEAEQIATPFEKQNYDRNSIDGIVYNELGNPKSYYVLDSHPGDFNGFDNNYNSVPAGSVIHWFKTIRPGQCRGIPEIMPALPLFGQLRRYSLAVIAAAETAADFAAVIFSDAPADGDIASLDPMDVVELERRMATVLPEGWKLGQMDAVQPTTTYGDFKKEILNEIARCLNMPYNVAACNSAGYNYASGRLDHQTYYKNIAVDQKNIEIVGLNKILRVWFNEAILISDFLPLSWRTLRRIPHQWFWDGREHVDPAKEANAQDTRLNNYSTNHAIEYAKQGRDWEKEFIQIAKEKALKTKLGLIDTDINKPKTKVIVNDKEDDDE